MGQELKQISLVSEEPVLAGNQGFPVVLREQEAA